MGLNEEQLKAAQQCMSAEELVQKASEAGHDLTLEQAQKIIDSAEMVEIDEDDLDTVSGGEKKYQYYYTKGIPVSGPRCSACGKSTLYFIVEPSVVSALVQCGVCRKKYWLWGNPRIFQPCE